MVENLTLSENNKTLTFEIKALPKTRKAKILNINPIENFKVLNNYPQNDQELMLPSYIGVETELLNLKSLPIK
ncbi:UNVERIFIED_CONTAM: hypothetical protein O8I53_11650 [Campylobacter lari]